MTFRNSSDLYSPLSRTHSSGLCAFLPIFSLVPLLLTLHGDFSETKQFVSATVRPATVQIATVQTFIHDSPPHLHPAILQAVLEDTYIDDGGVDSSSRDELFALQQEIEKILNKGGFLIKSWEKSGKDDVSKYLGMTWDRLRDLNSLKFCLNLHKKSRGIPSGADLDSDFLQDESLPITKKNVLSVACQFYDPIGLAAPLMFSVRALFSEICHDPSIRSCLRNVLQGLELQWEKSYSPGKYFSLGKFYSSTKLNSSYFSTDPYKDMVLVFMCTLAVNSTLFLAPQRY